MNEKHTKRKEEYLKKLRDPRWQKMRLKILERDNWECQSCHDKEDTLHVHHKYYNGLDPWQYQENALITLCVTCHQEETECRPSQEHDILRALKQHFLSSDLDQIRIGLYHFANIELVNHPFIVSGALEWLLCDPKNMKKLIEMYFEALPHRKHFLDSLGD